MQTELSNLIWECANRQNSAQRNNSTPVHDSHCAISICHRKTNQLKCTDNNVPPTGADLRSGHLCSGRRGHCHMVLGGPWWKSIFKNLHYSCQNRIFTPSNSVHAVRPVDNNNDMPFPSQKFNLLNVWVAWPRCCGRFALGGGFKDWPLVQWPMRPLPYGPRRPLMKINKKICITAAKTGFLLLQTVYGR